MTDGVLRCLKFQPKQRRLEGKDNSGPCRWHGGGEICRRRDEFRCETHGYPVWPWRADSDDDGEG